MFERAWELRRRLPERYAAHKKIAIQEGVSGGPLQTRSEVGQGMRVGADSTTRLQIPIAPTRNAECKALQAQYREGLAGSLLASRKTA